MKKNIIVLSVLILAFAAFSVNSFAAAGTTEDYGYLKGKANHYGTGGEQTFVYSHENHSSREGRINTEDLVSAGIIDEAAAEEISAYMAEKHEKISSVYKDLDSMTDEERHAAFAKRKTEHKNGSEELVEAGIISEEQLAEIKAYIEENR